MTAAAATQGTAAEAPLDCTSLIENGWFMEKNQQWPGHATSVQVQEVLLHERTQFQDLMVFESTNHGRVLVLDGVIQLTEHDEMSYQEMMAHLPLFAHEQPTDVLIIGGGDGGVLREVCKHGCVERVTMCEIDGGVVEAAKKFFPSVSCAFGDSRVTLIVGDGVALAEKAQEASYDVVIIDSSDPIGPAAKLFSKEFYVNAHRILRSGGVVCSQGECLWVHADLIEAMLKENGQPFATAEYASIQVPTYPHGQIGAFLARKAVAAVESGGGGDAGAGGGQACVAPTSCRFPRRSPPSDMELRYYTPEMHAAAFALPAFVQRRIASASPGTPGHSHLNWGT